MSEKNLILASSSPRRRNILRDLGLCFDVCPSHVEEVLVPGESMDRAAKRLARLKSEDVARGFETGLVLGADTIVGIDGELLGKPADPEQMRAHLAKLSGKTHQVITGIYLCDAQSMTGRGAFERTQVEFDQLTPADIEWYAETGEGLDKAGSYAIQGFGSLLVRRIHGCYFNVMGLPVVRLRRLFRAMGFDLLEHANQIGETDEPR